MGDSLLSFCRQHVRSVIVSILVGAGVALFFAVGRRDVAYLPVATVGALVGLTIFIFAESLERLFRPSINRLPPSTRVFAHAVLFLIAGSSGWIVGVIVGFRLFGERLTISELVHGRGATFMILTGVVAVAVGLVFRTMEILRERLTETVAQLKEHEWAEKELEMARAIQKRLLPPPRIEDDHFLITARNLPARYVAGDFYDVVKLDDGSVAIIVADVAGKGMGASLIMASVKAVLPFVAREPVESAMTTLNDKLVTELGRREFVALTFARYFPSTHVLQLANAGFPDPYLLRGASVEPLVVDGIRLPLGIRPGARYSTIRITLRDGDRVVFLSDGLPEATTAVDTPLGYIRLSQILSECDQDGAGSGEWIDSLIGRVRSEVQQPLSDDWTALVLDVRG